jgi:hypothetical protein
MGYMPGLFCELCGNFGPDPNFGADIPAGKPVRIPPNPVRNLLAGGGLA